MAEIADITIIGAGAVGLAVTSQVARKDRGVYLLEKNDTFGQEQSGRSSEVIHAGIYYPPDSLKMRLCIEGNRLIYEICENNGISCQRCGKIFIATDDDEAETLEGLYYNGINNGLPLKWLSREELRDREPHVNGTAAFLSPDTGVMDSHALMRHYFLTAREKEARTAYRSEVTGIDKIPDGYRLRIESPSGTDYLDTRLVINCAGIYSDRIAELAGINIDTAGYRLSLAKGEYYSVSGGKDKMINSLIYPTPDSLGPGIHVCLDKDHRLRLGPLMYYVDEVDYRVDDSRRKEFEESSLMKSLAFIEPADLEPESSGIMVMLSAHGERGKDFIIRHEEDRGFPGLINLIGIDSPGLTSSPAIAGYVNRIVDEILN